MSCLDFLWRAGSGCCPDPGRDDVMCGIAGRVGTGDGPTVSQMVASLAHRGPDASGVRTWPACELGARRLRIVDLSPDADQPMRGETDAAWVVYNGEIYNHAELRAQLEQSGHVFRSHSDTEVIVHGYEQWGEGIVARLRGMFAFAVWDCQHQRLILARDRLGIKPLYLRDHTGGGLSFASEAHALGPSDVDPKAVVSFLRLGWVGRGATIGAGIRELPPGHLLAWSEARSETRCYWHPEWRDEPVQLERLSAALHDSVARHLVADVPVGVFLSSGIDSTAIAVVAARHQANLRTYTVAFDGGVDESVPAARLARDIGAMHEVVRVSGADILVSLPSIIGAMDQPTVDGVNSWVISKAVREAGATVALSGLGGDELFQGYSTFHRAPQIASLGAHMPPLIFRGASQFATLVPRFAWGRMHRAIEAAGTRGLPAAYGAVRGLFSWSAVKKLWPGSRDALPELRDEALLVPDGVPNCTVGGLELANYLPFQLLRDTDVMSMAHSLEVRVPLLDDEVVGAALALRPTAEGLHGKRLLVAAADLTAVSSLARAKLTFTPAFERWLASDLRAWVRHSLAALGASSLGFDVTTLRSVDEAYLAGRAGWRSVWALAVLGAWFEQRGH